MAPTETAKADRPTEPGNARHIGRRRTSQPPDRAGTRRSRGQSRPKRCDAGITDTRRAVTSRSQDRTARQLVEPIIRHDRLRARASRLLQPHNGTLRGPDARAATLGASACCPFGPPGFRRAACLMRADMRRATLAHSFQSGGCTDERRSARDRRQATHATLADTAGLDRLLPPALLAPAADAPYGDRADVVRAWFATPSSRRQSPRPTARWQPSGAPPRHSRATPRRTTPAAPTAPACALGAPGAERMISPHPSATLPPMPPLEIALAGDHRQ
jgi:hypothetical protein